jgi:PIN domain
MMPVFGSTAILDACVLYPAPVRDLLLHLADGGLYRPKWTDQIQDEWTRNLLLNRPDLTAPQLQKAVLAMNGAFPDATVVQYEPLIKSVQLPDPDDAHVLAAAIRGQASIIVTANLRDFPNAYLSQFDIVALHPDELITSLIESHPAEVLQAFLQQVATLRNPPKTVAEVLQILQRSGLEMTSGGLSAML